LKIQLDGNNKVGAEITEMIKPCLVDSCKEVCIVKTTIQCLFCTVQCDL